MASDDCEKVFAGVDLLSCETAVFLKKLQNALDYFSEVESLNQTLDALQATRPFYKDLFRYYLEGFHMKLIDLCKRFWHKNKAGSSVGSVNLAK